MDQVYAIEGLNQKLVALLLKECGTALTECAIASKLGVPLWAVRAALGSAVMEELVTFAAGQGYWIAPRAPTTKGKAI